MMDENYINSLWEDSDDDNYRTILGCDDIETQDDFEAWQRFCQG